MRWDSPPERVSALRLRLRYPSPTSCMLFRMAAALGREEKNSAASSTVRASAWAMDFPFQVTSNVSLL